MNPITTKKDPLSGLPVMPMTYVPSTVPKNLPAQPASSFSLPSVDPTAGTGDLRTQLRAGLIDGSDAVSQYKLSLAQQYGADVSSGSPQFKDTRASDAYGAAIKGGLASLFGGLGIVKYGSQYGEYNNSGEYSRESTAVNNNIINAGGVDTSTQALYGGLTPTSTQFSSTLAAPDASGAIYQKPGLPKIPSTLSSVPLSPPSLT